MVLRVRAVLILSAFVSLLGPAVALAQVGSIAGTVRDSQGGVLPGVTVEVTSPQLIEKVRSTTTDGNGRYQIVSLPVGIYKVTFKLEKFSTVERININLTTDFTAPVNADMKLGATTETVTVVGAAAQMVDVKSTQQRQVFTAEELRDLPTTRDLPSLVNLVPGIMIDSADVFASRPRICSGGAGDSGTTGAQSGCGPVLNAFNSHSTMNDVWDTSLNRGRIMVDGMNIMGVGISTTADRDGAGGSASTTYLADVQNAQEVTFTLSGSLGESETGGATINIVPRTGGNRYTGNYFTSYGDQKFYDRNEGTRTRSGGLSFNLANQLDYDFDNNGSFGGPIIRDRLWFQAGARYRGRQTTLPGTYYNLNEGVFGANYVVDRDRLANSNDIYKSANLRLTVQASQKNKLNIYWDEQYTCSNPCKGTTNGFTSPEGQASQLSYPLHVAQLSWTNPLTNKILLDGGLSWNGTHTDYTVNRFLPEYNDIPKIVETGAGVDFGNKTSGSINSATYTNSDRLELRASAGYVTGSHNAKLGYQGSILSAVQRNKFNDMRLQYNYTAPTATSLCTSTVCQNEIANGRAAANNALIVTAPTGALAIQQGCYQNPTQLATPPTAPNATFGYAFGVGVANGGTSRPWCGSINLANDPNGMNNPVNSQYRPVPTSFIMYIPTVRDEEVNTHSLYLQDQWTLNRFTMNGAIRYDLATSHYNETCVGPDLFMQGRSYCLNDPSAGEGRDGTGVNFQDITPRWGVAWDVFGNGKTAVKWNMGKYVGGGGIGGVYTASNPASGTRTQNTFQRNWTDLDGDRIVDCDLRLPIDPIPASTTSIPAEGECGAITTTSTNSISTYRRFGRDPYEFDVDGQAIGLTTLQCGRNDTAAIPPAIQNYCADYFRKGGSSLLNGWNKRQYEWQFSLGVQHELLPRLSVEVTYNRRWTKNQTLTDVVGLGCDLYSARADGTFEFGEPDPCMNQFLNWQSDTYDFFQLTAPQDLKLPHRGGYVIPGFLDRKPNCPPASTTCTGAGTDSASLNAANQQISVQTLDLDGRRVQVWRGVDVNATLRARGGIRLTGGTSTGGSIATDCRAIIDSITQTSAILREGREQACERVRPFQTNVRGTATWTIPWVDVLLSSTFSYRPGTQISATYQFNVPADIQWMPGSEYRAGNTTGCSATVPAGCLIGVSTAFGSTGNTSQTFSTNLLSDDTFGEGIRLFDIKLAKNFRFSGKRLNVGMDIYNLFNSDAALGYCGTFPTCTTGGQVVEWMTVNQLTTPRYARFQLQFDF